jgi:tetratricopeptide (TPR) repeat protein
MATFLTNDILEPLAAESFKPKSIREIFTAAEEKLTIQFADYPLLEASMRWTFGNIYRTQFGDYGAAVSQMERFVELRQEYGVRVRDWQMNWLAVTYDRAGRYEDAEAIFRPIMERHDRGVERGSFQPSRFSCAVKGNLGHTYRLLGHYEKAEHYVREALDMAPWPKESCPELIYRGGLAFVLMERGRYDEAKDLWKSIWRTGLKLQDRGYSGMTRHEIEQTIGCTLFAMHQLGVLHDLQGNLIEAESTLEAALQEHKDTWGPEHSRTIEVKISLAVLLTELGAHRHKEAETFFAEALSNMEDRLDYDHPKLLRTKSYLGVLYREQGRRDEAEKLLSEVIEDQSEKLGPDHPHTLQSMHELAILHVKQDQHQQAVGLLVKVAEGRLVKLGDEHPHTRESLSLLINLYKTLNQAEEAEKWRTKLPRTEAIG